MFFHCFPAYIVPDGVSLILSLTALLRVLLGLLVYLALRNFSTACLVAVPYARHFLSFLNLLVYCLHQIWKIRSRYFVKYFFGHSFFRYRNYKWPLDIILEEFTNVFFIVSLVFYLSVSFQIVSIILWSVPLDFSFTVFNFLSISSKVFSIAYLPCPSFSLPYCTFGI